MYYEDVHFSKNCRLPAWKFTKNELLHRYFSRILTANFRTSRSSCDCDINLFYPNVVFYVETTQFIYSTDQLTGFYVKDYICIGKLKPFMSICHLLSFK